MRSRGKTRRQAARNGEGRPLLKRLKPGEAAAVLRCLLEAHPDLADEAEGFARSVLHQLKYQDVAAEIEDEIRQLDYEDLNARAGNHEWGYVEPSEAAWEILEQTVQPFLDEMKRYLELGLKAEALEICKGLVLGCYRLGDHEGGDVLGWAPDFPAEAAGTALQVWCTQSADSTRRPARGKRSPLPSDFLCMVPNWFSMIEGIGKKAK